MRTHLLSAFVKDCGARTAHPSASSKRGGLRTDRPSRDANRSRRPHRALSREILGCDVVANLTPAERNVCRRQNHSASATSGRRWLLLVLAGRFAISAGLTPALSRTVSEPLRRTPDTGAGWRGGRSRISRSARASWRGASGGGATRTARRRRGVAARWAW